MKIYFSGAHGIGKSTCARYVSEKYKLILLPEVARIILAEKELQVDTLRYDMNIVNNYQTEVFERQIVEESNKSSFVSDRSAIDALAYSAQHTHILPILLKNPQLNNYISLLKEKSSYVFFVRPTKATLKNDGVREALNWEGIIAIDAIVKTLYEMFEVPYYQINTDNMQERTRLIDTILSK